MRWIVKVPYVTKPRTKSNFVLGFVTMTHAQRMTEKDRLLDFLSSRSMARARDLRAIGVSGTAISRAVEDGDVIRIGRGLYQLADADIDANISLAEVAKRVPKAVICLVSALAFHGLTDQLPRKVWIAIGAKDWEPKLSFPAIRSVRFREPYFSNGVETHQISGVDVTMYTVPKSIADAFRNPKLVDRSVAIESLRTALEMRKASIAELAKAADIYGARTRMMPVLEALAANG